MLTRVIPRQAALLIPLHQFTNHPPLSAMELLPLRLKIRGRRFIATTPLIISPLSHGPPIARVLPWARILSYVSGMQPPVSTSSPTIPTPMVVPACYPWHGHLMDNVSPTAVETSRYGMPKQVICISPSHPH